MATARVRRARKTEDLLAARWRQLELFPDAESIAASLPGRDVKNTLGFAVEVKARRKFNPIAWIKQSKANADGDWPVVVMRPDGMGEASMGKWLVFMELETFEEMVRDLQQGEVSHWTRDE